MDKYQRGKVYAIVCNKTGRRYVGSTCEPKLARRLSSHVQDFKNWDGEKKCCSSFNIIKDGDYYIVLLESYPCNSRDELRMCEQKHIDLCECVNKQKAFQSEEDFKECNKKWQKIYYDKNREKIAERVKQRNLQNREKNKAYRQEKVCCPTCQKMLQRHSLIAHKKICPKNLMKNQI
jgi:predicted GIY-YIG superfamily endonuclease